MKLEIYGSASTGFSAHGESESEELLPCPWCNSTEIFIANTHTPHYQAECDNCGAQGPQSGPVKVQARRNIGSVRKQHVAAFTKSVTRWNSRMDKTLAPEPITVTVENNTTK